MRGIKNVKPKFRNIEHRTTSIPILIMAIMVYTRGVVTTRLVIAALEPWNKLRLKLIFNYIIPLEPLDRVFMSAGFVIIAVVFIDFRGHISYFCFFI